MKQQFIQSLKDTQISFLDNERELAKLTDDIFEPFDENLVKLDTNQHRWNESYFNKKAVDLDFNFSKALVEHLIAVKRHYQNAQTNNQPSQMPQVTTPKIQDEQNKSNTISTSMHNTESPTINVDLANFKPKEKLLTLLKAGNISEARSYLMLMLNNRRLSLDELFKSIWYVHQYHSNVFEAEEEENAFIQNINTDESAWNNEYFNKQQVYLNRNFSLGRLLHLANVRQTLMERGDEKFQQIKTQKDSTQQADIKPKSIGANTRSSSVTPKAETLQSHHTHSHNQDNQSDHKSSQQQFLKTLVIVGGAVLALGTVLFVILR